MQKKALLEIVHLKKNYTLGNQLIRAVNDVCLTIEEGETLGIVGESGSGKSTLGRLLVKLEEASEGHIYFMNKDITQYSFKQMQAIRQQIQIIFQDPYASLNPRMTVGDIIAEPIDIHQRAEGALRQEKIKELLICVGLNPTFSSRFPHELSGGQRQRVGIARALALEPKFIVCDEPISALDVSVQAQIINLLKHLQKEKNLTYLFIAHDLRMVRYISTKVAVMYLGKIVELAYADALYTSPLHPYTQALLSAQPIADPRLERERKKLILPGDIKELKPISKGCVFASRCPHATKVCHDITPKWKEKNKGHFAACHLM